MLVGPPGNPTICSAIKACPGRENIARSQHVIRKSCIAA
ncbi:hypothetical protein ApDm4_1062 [Acetobacter pomorum]|nr:hypothetical protein ApDm4_1062 [Acetobacter pomorum]